MAKRAPATRSARARRPSEASPKRDQLASFTDRPGETTLTTNQGLPINDDQNSLKAGERGPSLLEDFHLREKITHFDHERIPERVVHARGSAAHGVFQVYESLAEADEGRLPEGSRHDRHPVFVRFSTVAGSRGSTDLARDVRGLRRQVLHRRGELRPRRQQHAGVLHPGRHQVSRPRSTP